MSNRAVQRIAGLSLIEMMVALAIGSLLILGLVQVFAASRAASITAEGMSRVQENGRFAIDFLQRDIRMAGHFGCVNDQAHWVTGADELVNHFGTSVGALNFGVSIIGYEAADTEPGDSVTIGAATATWSPALPAEISAIPDLVPGSDIIALRYLNQEGIPVEGLAPISGGNTEVEFPSGRADALTAGGVGSPVLFGVSDCAQVDVFGGAISGNTVASSGALADFSGRYTTAPSGQTLLFRAESIVYYIAPGASGEPALWRARANGLGAYPAANREELVEGIESLQFLYGRDSTVAINQENPPSGNITLQDTANTVGATAAEWRRVGLVQVGLLARSPSPAASQDAADPDARPRVLGVQFDPPTTPDARYRSTYEVTVALRNRLFGN